MTIPPQNVTARYLSNLLRDGQNETFTIHGIELKHYSVGEDHVGVYFELRLRSCDPTVSSVSAVGATIHQALERALVKFGVTFR